MQRTTHLEVPKRERFCLNCKTAFKADMPYVSSVSSESYETWDRKDYCPSCWETIFSSGQQRAAIWKSEVPKKQEELDLECEKNEHALALLLDYCHEKNTDITLEEAYFLALYLVRKKVLTESKSKNLQQAQFEVKKTGEKLFFKPVSWKNIDPLEMQKKLEGFFLKTSP